VIAQEPLSGVTLLLESDGSDEIATQVIESSRKIYAQKLKPIESIKQEKVKTEKRTERKRKTEANKHLRNEERKNAKIAQQKKFNDYMKNLLANPELQDFNNK
jgi:hypothetical protein